MKPSKPITSGPVRQGFALVVNFSLMILLTIIAVGLLSLSAVSLRASSQGQAAAEARANARLALMMAIGESQKEMGPDSRISAPHDAGTTATGGQPRWTAVYHKDHGEGLDAFKVGDTRGCGGTALWIDGKPATTDTYLSAEIIWTSPDVAEFHTTYRYPVKLEGKPLFEYRVTRLKTGERLCDVTSTFSNQPNQRFSNRKLGTVIPHEVVIRLTAQSKDASITLDAAKGIAAIHGSFAGSTLGTGIVVNPAAVIRTEMVPASGKDSPGTQAMLVVRPVDEGRLQCRTGFAWAADGEFTTEKTWLEYLES